MARTGRPTKELNEKQFKNMCIYQCTQQEIEAFLDTDHKTIDSWCQRTYEMSFSQSLKKFSDGGKKSLRRAMWHKAVKEKNTGMMIWLSKQYLGMKDKIDDDNIEMEPFVISTTQGVMTLGIKKKEGKDD